MKKQLIHFIGFVVLILLTWGITDNPYSSRYLVQLKNSAPTFVSNDSLYQEIVEKAKGYEEKPIDAVIDPVWKAIPGYDGVKVNIEKSYDIMKKKGKFEEEVLVMQPIKPKILLNDLPASPIYRGNDKKPMVSFIVNVAWGNEHIPEILKILKENHVQATFFLEGRWVKNNSELAEMIFEAGHEIGNHSFSHPDMGKLSRQLAIEEIQKTNDVIQATLDIKPKWFGPPSGSYNQQTIEAASQLGMKTVLWSVDTVDWRNPNPSDMVERVRSKLHPGAMVLMHPTEATVKGLEGMIKAVEKKEYKLGKVSTLLSEQRIEMIHSDR
ncbi:polysaccharide deacetylase family protein [Bacillus solimangrovi]|uniref:NodB homology domain-containing protein n=1 Tax=Bacillus solimangrovi TaxID=1305675 RepID=A0A1E5LDY6_9BACI|nr:polysaccharide deacetylase family protein [Bacillus solimangrovi]OEH92311.1 hypothetical protein BFG57_16500 [Bacillus solimangrovi]